MASAKWNTTNGICLTLAGSASLHFIDCRVADPVYEPGYAGCFKEPLCSPSYLSEPSAVTITRALREIAVERGMTIQRCKLLATQKGLRYAALQRGDTCHGGNSLAAYNTSRDLVVGSAAQLVCGEMCDGNTEQMCGGECASSVYTTGECPVDGD
jgi:hypothetical protein